jgi:SAM-dependent methyltransferase
LSAWDAAVKIAAAPLLATYQQLQLLVDDVPGTSRTVNLSIGVEALPLLEACADLVICRNALDHMPEPHRAVGQMARILKPQALLFLSVDMGGVSTPDEPIVFSVETLIGLLQEHFVIVHHTDGHPAHSGWRAGSVRLVARKKPSTPKTLDKVQIL